MDIRKLSWTRGLALFVALTVIMMYSMTSQTFAGGGPDDGPHNLTISYVYEDGSVAYTTYVASLDDKVTYSILSPVIDKFEASILDVNGTMHKQDIDITVIYIPHLHEVTYNKGGGDPTTKYIVGSTVTVAAFGSPPNGKIFTGWKLNGNDTDLDEPGVIKYQAGDTFTMPNNNINFKAVFKDDSNNPPTFDLEVNKTVNNVSSVTVSSGAIVTFVITVTNNSTTAATDVVVKDILPTGLIINTSNASIGSYNGDEWNIGQLGVDADEILTVTAIASATSGTMTNTAIVTSAGIEADTGDNTASAEVTVDDGTTPPLEPDRDLGIFKTVNLSNVRVGTGVIFTITLRNNGETTYSGIEVQDTWPEGLTQGTVTPTSGTSFIAETKTWQIDEIGPGEVKVLTIVAGTSIIGEFTNMAQILFGKYEGDDESRNNTASAIVTVNPVQITGGGDTTPSRRTPTATIVETPPPLVETPIVETPIIDEPVALADVPDPNVPQTGDTNNILLLLGLLLASGTGIVALGRRKETAGK